MAFFVVRDPTKSSWMPASFPYTVYEGRENIAGTRRVVTVTQTLRGAKRVIKQVQAAKADIPVLAVYGFDELPDLRVSELAPGRSAESSG